MLTLLYRGLFHHFLFLVVFGQPTLNPLYYHVCPDENATFVCHASQVRVIVWEVKEYFTSPMQYFAEHLDRPDLTKPINRENKFFATLTNSSRRNGAAADMTTSLLIITNGLENGTNITCRIGTNNFKTHLSSSILYFAGSYFHIFQWNTVMLVAIYICYRCTMFKSTFNHIPKEGDIFHSCTGSRRYV